MATNWKKIDAPYLFVYVAERGSRKAEVLRAYSQDWRVFRYVHGAMLRNPAAESFATPGAARRSVARWLED